MFTRISLCQARNGGWVAYIRPEGKAIEYLPYEGYYENKEAAEKAARRLTLHWYPKTKIEVVVGTHIPNW
jgi:hypothetical protein